ncbi:MAG: hypothetical protein RMZ41_011600 [Nostoc sp. DedVER02]|uniref:hypothetical protein n=1 Tax=unclassified Nostoc TaxID=2593658 RepID=UPI002AD389FE|nr:MULTISPECIES: hypothetical protein [unclassified Nostoc]MDZ7989715.1 hypothetical protein [Nostoc sp. DedVER02]MDZ8113451.1 hypothetical protein [Nostoc sp. DedVER01b]
MLIEFNPLATRLEDYAVIARNAKIRIKARKRIGTRDDDSTAIIEEWWATTDLLAYLPAWDYEDRQKGRDYAVIAPQSEFYPSWWYKSWEWHKNQTQELTRARSSFDIHPDDYAQLLSCCTRLLDKLSKPFLISRSGIFWNWQDFKI